MWTRRLSETVAMLMIGEGVVAAIEPRRHLLIWEGGGPEPYRKMVEGLLDRPELVRALGLAEAALGVAWSLTLTRD